MTGFPRKTAPRLSRSPAPGKLRRLGAQRAGEAAEGARVAGGELPELVALGHPVGLIGLVAGAIVDRCGRDPSSIARRNMAWPRMVPGRELLGALGISELVDGGLAILDQPELRGDRLAVLAGDAEPERARPRLPVRRARAGRRESLRRASSSPDRPPRRPPRRRRRSGRGSRCRARPPWRGACRCCAAGRGARPNNRRSSCPSVSIRQLPVRGWMLDQPARGAKGGGERLGILHRRERDAGQAALPQGARRLPS